jgi:hypothetical protein
MLGLFDFADPIQTDMASKSKVLQAVRLLVADMYLHVRLHIAMCL